MQFTARLRQLQASPQKVRLVVDLIRGKDVEEGSAILAATPKSAARPLAKLLPVGGDEVEPSRQMDRRPR